MSKEVEYIEVKIIKVTDSAWYKVGEIHKVLNKIVFWEDGCKPHFSKTTSTHAIKESDCEILSLNIKKLTIADIEKELGYKIEIIS